MTQKMSIKIILIYICIVSILASTRPILSQAELCDQADIKNICVAGETWEDKDVSVLVDSGQQ